MSAHTPGPWVFGNWADKKQGELDGASWVEIWSLHDGDDALPFVACKHQDQLANARLIAAAPELLEALANLTQVLKAAGYGTSKADAAIAKATGGAA